MDQNPYSAPIFDPNKYAGEPSPAFDGAPPARLHSKLGIASFIMALVGGLAMMALVAIAGYMEASNPGGLDEESPQAIALGLGILGMIAFLFLAFVLGVAGLFQPNRQKVFAIIGALLSGVAVACVVALMVIGLTMGA